MSSPEKRFLVAGYYGFGNAGDEAILAALLAELRARLPNVRVTVLSGGPERTRSLHGVEALSYLDVNALKEAAASADVFVTGGGGLFADYWPVGQEDLFSQRHFGVLYYAMLPLLSRALGKRSAIVGAGVGPLTSDDGRSLTRLAFSECDRVAVRDRESLAVLESLGAPTERVAVTADLAFLFRPASQNIAALKQSLGVPKDRKLLVAALRPWERAGLPWEPAVAVAIDRFLELTGAHVLFLPFQKEVGADEDDVAVGRRIREAMRAKSSATVLAAPLAPEMTAALIQDADAVLAMRFHAAIFALAGGREPCALAYDPKLASIMRDAGVERSLFPLAQLDPEKLSRSLLLASKERETNHARLSAFAAEKAELARKNIDPLVELADLPPRVPDEPMRLFAEQLIQRSQVIAALQTAQAETRAELDNRVAEVKFLRSHLQSITGSNTFRLAERARDLSYKTVSPGSPGHKLFRSSLNIARQARALGARGVAKKYLPEPFQAPLLSAYHGLKELKHKDRRAEDRKALQDILRAHPQARDIWVLAPSIPWDVALFQRPQQLAMALARLGVLLFYVDPSPKPEETGFLQLKENLYVSRVDREIFQELEDFTLYVLSWNKAWGERLRPKRVVYDFIDDLDVFNVPDPEQLKRDHQTLLHEATVVSATADLLWREVHAVRKDSILCANGVDYAHFVVARDPALPAPDDLADILAQKKPIIGYYGAIARWFDYELLWAVASKRPDLYFLLLGPDYDKTATGQSLFGLPNVRWPGPRHYSILAKYLKCFDVATIPFKLNAITHATSPLKLFEYMAGGKTIVTTPMRESMRYENVLVGGDPNSFSRKLDEALSLRSDPEHMKLTDRLAKENTWDARAEQLLSALQR